MLKDRFTKKFPLADFDAVYARIIRDNKDDFEKALKLLEVGEALPPFSHFVQADKTYIAGNLSVEFLSNNFSPEYKIGFDKEAEMFYVYKPSVFFVHSSLEQYVECLIEVMIS